ncbi:MAG: aromatic ring-hydroxylating dioxygenase subunit alpha [Myxococcota bacterium]
MDRGEQKGLIERIARRIATGTTDECEAPVAESAEDFLSPERFEKERERLFLDSPQVIGFAGEVAQPGSFVAREAMGVPILVTRDRGGRLHAFLNACGHRGARLAEGHGRASGGRLVCRFHAWSYGLDGRLASRPSAASFDAADAGCDLVRLPVSDRSGLLVVGLRPSVSQGAVDDHLVEIEAQLAGLGLERAQTLDERRYDVAASWKLVSMLSYESYHFASLHRDTVATMFEANAIADVFGRHSRWAFALKGTDKLLEQDPSAWPDHFPGALSFQLFPGTVLITTWEIAQLIRSEPGARPGESVVHVVGGYFDAAKREVLQANYDLGRVAFEQEDLPAAVESQRGIALRGGRFFVGRNEPIVAFWLGQWRDALRD